MTQVGRRPDIAAVAAAAGVSVTTVSHVLSGRRPVSEATRAKVEAVIEELGYRPNPSARSLRTHRSESVALIVPDITNPFYPAVAAGLQDVLLGKGYLLSVNDAALPSRALPEVVRHVLARRVDGIVLASYGATEQDIAEIARSGTKLVRLGGRFRAEFGDVVRADDVGGMHDVVSHLIERGYQRIAFVNGEQDAHPSRIRLEGYERAMREADRAIDPDLILSTTFTRAGGVEGATALLARSPRPDAIVCGNDLIAVGVLDVTRRLGLSVPGDLAITGYDDIEAASLVTPALTTVHNPAREIGRTCARMLLDRLAGDYDDVAREVVLAHRLVVRESS
ncbi:LacI family transcriptional regulator [Sinosporangium album]|uniref:LacI family transcriptional regulator n=1 Tax=Sinosporangium album TaxID=504805 RepID=A0A1G8B648_9ACTN|nr:LacI family DNA-binding transcriptional regulator [Sinosporangium album]SDH28699.1 LacI family transcriptional regulator [Sinosporangium album]